VVMASSQILKTACGTNFLGYVIDHAKGPIAVAMPTEKTLDDWIAQKFEPMSKSTPPVAASLFKRSNNSSDNSAYKKKFIGGILFFKTAGSTAELKNISLKNAIADEVDEWVWDTKQGDPLGLLEVRLTTYQSTRKLYVCSSPTLKDASRIEEMFNAGDRRRYHVPCPHCNELQPLVWANVKWSKHPDNPKSITDSWYVCRECGGEIAEHNKPVMLAEQGRGGRARWIAEVPGAPYPSFHISALMTR